MRILVWHVHGSWLTSFVQGPHEYLIPVLPGRGPAGRGRAATWDWPARAREVTPADLAGRPVDVVVLQRPEELELARSWLGARPGVDVPAVYVEHNAPGGRAPDTPHPLGMAGLTIVHVTWFNQVYWDCGQARVRVVEHGIPDPGARWTGELDRAAVVINDPVGRGRVTGTDLLPGLAAGAPLDVFGMRVTGLASRLALPAQDCREFEDLPQSRLHDELARRRMYLHPYRWTSLGLALIEAMMLAMPVVVLAATEAARAVPPSAGAVSTSPAELRQAMRRLLRDPAAAREAGRAARQAACTRHNLKRFLRDWDEILQEACA
jgi:glycosyltransferase involved in cell wall biosynthesis